MARLGLVGVLGSPTPCVWFVVAFLTCVGPKAASCVLGVSIGRGGWICGCDRASGSEQEQAHPTVPAAVRQPAWQACTLPHDRRKPIWVWPAGKKGQGEDPACLPCRLAGLPLFCVVDGSVRCAAAENGAEHQRHKPPFGKE